jgi:hypothetical protein
MPGYKFWNKLMSRGVVCFRNIEFAFAYRKIFSGMKLLDDETD